MTENEPQESGHGKLWRRFIRGQCFVVLPRAYMHEMPDEWQGRMADLLAEIDEALVERDTVMGDIGFVVRGQNRDGKLAKLPEPVFAYKYPHDDVVRMFAKDSTA